MEKFDNSIDILEIDLIEFCPFKQKMVSNMKKLKHYPSVWQAQPFSMEMFAHFEREARLRNQEAQLERQEVEKVKKSKLKLIFG
ncbi:hypothetical protein [uncultured Croceitalea sp.]|uniref:hypothetical protein n=1 Tax=uncultured Croceitalea sp. TaxID=1798908 RepID=UPI003305CB34